MATSQNKSKVVTPFMPTLLHFAAVKIAAQLFRELDVNTLEKANLDIDLGDSATSEGSSIKTLKAKENLLFIPPHLRQTVMEAVHGLHQVTLTWTLHHFKFKEGMDNFHWISDGSFDAVKTAKNLVHNAKFHIDDRFQLAGAYFLEESVLDLWDEKARSVKTKNFRMRHEGSLETAIQVENFPSLAPRCSTFFPGYSSEEGQINIDLLDDAPLDDLRICLYSLTKEEEEQMLLKKGPYRVLCLHLMWPLQTLFLQTAAKLWNYIDGDCFEDLIFDIFQLDERWDDFNYSELFEGFWNASPLHMRESARKLPKLKQRIDSYFEEKRRKR